MGDDVTIYRVINKHDDLFMILCTEWFDSTFKITIFSTEASLFIGEMPVAEVDTFAQNLSKTREEYLRAARNALSGKDESIEFYLKDSKLRWKKGSWNQGIVDVVSNNLSDVLPAILTKFFLHYKKLENAIENIERENRELKATQILLNEKLESMTGLKNNIEDKLYKKFLIILNSKKEKIRELETELKKKTSSLPDQNQLAVYEASTDNSELSEEEAYKSLEKSQMKKIGVKKFDFDTKRRVKKLHKRPIEDDDDKMINSDYGDEIKAKKNLKHTNKESQNKIKVTQSDKSVPEKPSTSKNDNSLSLNLSKDYVHKEGNNVDNSPITESRFVNTDNDESEEDLFL